MLELHNHYEWLILEGATPPWSFFFHQYLNSVELI